METIALFFSKMVRNFTIQLQNMDLSCLSWMVIDVSFSNVFFVQKYITECIHSIVTDYSCAWICILLWTFEKVASDTYIAAGINHA